MSHLHSFEPELSAATRASRRARRPLAASSGLALVLCLAAAAAACKEAPAEVVVPVPAVVAASSAAAPGEAPAAGVNPRLLRRFVPARAVIESASHPSTPEKVALGRMLYFEKRLSKNGDVACNSCHKLDAYGVDGEPTSPGEAGQRGGRNSPTVYHSAAAFVQFWDGRAADVEAQAKGPILNPIEMGMPSGDQVVTVLKAISGYAPLFARAFPGEREPLSFDNVAIAIGAFERGLTSPGRWDRYLAGEQQALTAPEIEGLKLFTNVGCMVCHTGELLGGNSYQRVGAVEPWPNQKDRGRSEVTKNAADDMMFKVPTLRNIARTGPYFHDGSAATLPKAVTMMGKHQLGLDLSDHEVAAIVTWLGALTGDLPTSYIQEPDLPAGPKTPQAL